MANNQISLKGYGEGQAYSVYVEVKFDSDQVYLVADESGTRVIISCEYSASVSSHTSNIVFGGGNARLTGVAGRISVSNSKRVLLIPWTSLSSSSKHFQLEIPINRSDVAWIEDARNGSDLTGLIAMHGAVSVKSKAAVDIPFNTSDGHEYTMPWHQQEFMGIVSESNQTFRMEREKWIRILNTLGAGSYVVELPLIDLRRRKEEWKKVVERFDKATADFRSGEYENTIGECRKVVEGIVTVVSAAWKIQPNPQHSFEQKTDSMLKRLRAKWPEEGQSKIDALGQLITAIWKWGGPYHHFEGAVPHRQETSFLLHLTANLVELSALILDGNPLENG